MNGRYGLAQTPWERVAIAMIAAIGSYFRENPRGVMPGQGYLASFIKPFLELEFVKHDIEKAIKANKPRAEVELDLAEQESRLYQICTKILAPHHET